MFGIYFFVILNDFIMQMRTGTSSCAADLPDIITDFDVLSYLYIYFGEVSEQGFQIVTVADDDAVSVTALYAGKFYFTVSGCAHRIPSFTPEIQTEMLLCRIFSKWILAVPEFRTYLSGNRQSQGSNVKRLLDSLDFIFVILRNLVDICNFKIFVFAPGIG